MKRRRIYQTVAGTLAFFVLVTPASAQVSKYECVGDFDDFTPRQSYYSSYSYPHPALLKDPFNESADQLSRPTKWTPIRLGKVTELDAALSASRLNPDSEYVITGKLDYSGNKFHLKPITTAGVAVDGTTVEVAFDKTTKYDADIRAFFEYTVTPMCRYFCKSAVTLKGQFDKQGVFYPSTVQEGNGYDLQKQK